MPIFDKRGTESSAILIINRRSFDYASYNASCKKLYLVSICTSGRLIRESGYCDKYKI